MKNCNFKSVFSIDVEDWFNISNVDSEPKITEWDNLPSRVERNFNKLLDIMLESKVKSTCFFLGYFAKRFPKLVTRAFNEGHEIASHGFYHQLAFCVRYSTNENRLIGCADNALCFVVHG